MLAFGTLIARTNARTDLPPAWPDSLDWMQGIDSSCLSKLMQVGYLAVFRGRLVEAQSIFQGLAVLRPASEIPLLGLAILEFSIGNLEKASRWLDAAEVLQPDAPHTLAIAAVVRLCLASQSCSEAH